MLASPPLSADTAERAHPTAATQHAWPLATVHRAVAESNPGQCRLFKHLADHPDEWLTTQQIARGMSLERKHIGGALSGLSRRAKHRYNISGWFFDAQWDGAQYTYRMHAREAAAVRAALGG